MSEEQRPYEVVIARGVSVPMRDGVRLATDLYLPAQDGRALPGPWPALLARTPYNKGDRPMGTAVYFAEHGYIVAVQDCRGRYASEGRFFPFVDEPEDGCDTVAWLARHPVCDGQVGTFGASHLAWVQFHAATQTPPALKTMIPMYGPTNAFHHSMREGGALHLWWLGWMIRLAEQGSHRAQAELHLARGLREQPLLPWLAQLPWQQGQSPLRHFPEYEEALFQMMEEDRYSAFWQQDGLAMDAYFAAFPEIPILWIGGWYDYYPHAISDSFARFAALGRKDQYLLMGPWDHSGCPAACGDVEFGAAAGITLRALQLQWFDFWLKGEGEAPLRRPVRFFVMGDSSGAGGLPRGQKTPEGRLSHGGVWRDAAAWPPSEAEPRRYFLQPAGGLAPEPPRESAAATTYTYDPRDPVPSLGWCYVSDPASGWSVPPGPRDLVQPAPLLGQGQAGLPLAARRDVLVFASAPLTEELRVAGPIEARLWIASDAPDTDFTARLSDIYPPSADYPAGYALPVAEGILRTRFRDSMTDPQPLVPGQPTEIRITVSPTANCFQTGHRLRLDISSSNFPRFEPNRNIWMPDSEISDSEINKDEQDEQDEQYKAIRHAAALPMSRAEEGSARTRGAQTPDARSVSLSCSSCSSLLTSESELRTWKSYDPRVRVAENCVYHDAAHPSHVTLWVLPAEP